MQPHILLISLVPKVGGLWSVSYLHGVVIASATKWKFVAALLMALPRPLSAHSAPQFPSPSPGTHIKAPFWADHVCGRRCCFNVSSVLFARVTYFDFICPLARETALGKNILK